MSENGPMWLTRSDDVIAHLYFAAAEIGAATLEIGSLRVPGSLSFPNSEQGTFSFFTHGEVDLQSVSIDPGQAVQFDYSQGDSTYSFMAYMTDISLWVMLTDLAPHQQCAAIIMRLGGQARELARIISPQEIVTGGWRDGRPLDPVT